MTTQKKPKLRDKKGQFVKGCKINFGKKHLSRKKAPPISEKTREKMRKKKIGKTPWMKGKKHTEKAKEKNRQAHKGNKNSRWRGGISFAPYTTDWTETLRQAIRERDRYTCQMPGCNRKQGDRAFAVHHIDYDKLNSNPDNLITLCTKCHSKTNSNRKYYINLLTNLTKKHYE